MTPRKKKSEVEVPVTPEPKKVEPVGLKEAELTRNKAKSAKLESGIIMRGLRNEDWGPLGSARNDKLRAQYEHACVTYERACVALAAAQQECAAAARATKRKAKPVVLNAAKLEASRKSVR